jgi:hypothetical protein
MKVTKKQNPEVEIEAERVMKLVPSTRKQSVHVPLMLLHATAS